MRSAPTAAASEKWKPATLGVIINQYKRTVTIGARIIHPGFVWQSRFHHHIIRNDESFQRILDYPPAGGPILQNGRTIDSIHSTKNPDNSKQPITALLQLKSLATAHKRIADYKSTHPWPELFKRFKKSPIDSLHFRLTTSSIISFSYHE